MKKTYCVEVDVTFSAQLWVHTETEEEARQIALDRVRQDPHFRVAINGHFVDVGVTDCFVDEGATRANNK